MYRVLLLVSLLFRNMILQMNESNNLGKSKFARIISNVALGVVLILLLSQQIILYFFIAKYFDYYTFMFCFYVVTTFLTIILSISIVISNLYLSKDYITLVPLPLKSIEIICAKFLYSLLIILLVNSITVIPCFIIGIVFFTTPFLVKAPAIFLVFLLLVLLFLSFIAILESILVKFEAIVKRRGFLTLSMRCLSLIGIFFIMLSSYKVLDSLLFQPNFEDFIRMINKIVLNFRIGTIGKFNPVIWATDIIASDTDTVLNIILLLALLAMLLSLFFLISTKTFRNLVQAMTISRIKYSTVGLLNTGNAYFNLIQRELWILSSEYYFILEAVTELLIGVSIFTGLKIFWTINEVDFIKATDFLDKYNSIELTIFALIVFFSTITSIGISGVSREGKNFYHSKTLPLEYKKQFTIKFIFCYAFISISAILSYLVIVLFDLFHIRLNPVLFFVSILAANFLISSIMVIFDFQKPTFTWLNPRTVLNSNINMLYGILTSLFIVVFVCSIMYALQLLNLSLDVIFLINIAITTSIGSYIFRNMRRKSDDLYRKINSN